MLKIQSILVPTDLSESARGAFAVARDLARRFDAAIHVLHVKPTSSQFAAFARWFSGDLPEPDRAQIEQELDAHYGGHEKLKYVEREGAGVADEILDYATDCSVDLIVMGTHGHRSLDHPALGGAAGDVVRRAEQHVLTVRSHDDGSAAPTDYRRIIVGIDFAEDSRALVRAAKQLASFYDAPISLVFVSEEHNVPFFSDTGMMTVTTLKLDDEITAHADEALRQIDEETGSSDVEVDYVVRTGNPARELVSLAHESANNLFVVGRRGHSPPEGFLLGTVTEHIVRTSPCPVLTLAPH